MAYSNTTQVTGGGGNPFQNSMNAFAPVYGMFGSPGGKNATNIFGGGGGGGGAGGIGAFSGLGNPFGLGTNPNDPHNIAFYSNLINSMGVSGGGLLGGGANLINLGTGVTGAGLGVTGGGLGMLGQPYNYWSQLMSGNPATVAAAAGPYSTLVSGQETNALNNLRGLPSGGFAALGAAELPQAAAAQVGNFELGLQPQAAQQLAGLGGEVANIGLGIGGLGQNIAGTGTTLTGQGAQMWQNAVADALNKIQLNYEFGGPQTAASLLSSIGALLGGGGQLGKAINPGDSCWIAEAIYGVDDVRTHLVRAYLNGPFRETAFGRLVMVLYSRFGQRIAAQARKRNWLKRAFRPLFDRALVKAIGGLYGARATVIA